MHMKRLVNVTNGSLLPMKFPLLYFPTAQNLILDKKNLKKKIKNILNFVGKIVL